MDLSSSRKDDGSSNLVMIDRVGVSSRKPGFVMWSLFGRFSRYLAHIARINF